MYSKAIVNYKTASSPRANFCITFTSCQRDRRNCEKKFWNFVNIVNLPCTCLSTSGTRLPKPIP